jgi:tetratricopeptide (TPR) repeat protein
MAVILLGQQQYQEAVMLLESILIEVPDSDRVRFSLGAAYYEMQEWDKALYHLTLVPHFSSYYVDAITQAVSILREQKKIKEAEKLLQSAIAKRDEATQFYVLYATVLDDQKKYEENSKFLAAAKEKFPDSSMILFLYAMNFDRVNDKETALKWMQTVLEKDENHALAMNFIAYTYAEQNRDLEKALSLAKRANEIEPNNPFIQDTLGWIYYQKGQYKTALIWLEKAFNGSKDESIIMDHLGDAYYKMGLVEKAQIMYDLALESSDEEAFKQAIKSKLQAIRLPDSKFVPKERIPAAVPKNEGLLNNQ